MRRGASPTSSTRAPVVRASTLIMLIVVATLVAGRATPLTAQSDSALHVTFRGWAETSWLHLLDRNASSVGRLSDLGILQRFRDDIDDKYHLDQLTTAFRPTEDYEWYRRERGVRWLTGSITKRDLLADGEFRAIVPLSKRWSMAIRFDKEDNPEVRRNTFRFAFQRTFDAGFSGAIGAHMDPNKPGSDIELNVAWTGPGGPNVRFAVAAIDAFNDLIYLNLNAANQTQIDTTLEYETQPIAARLDADVPLGSHVRLEAYGAYMRPSTILAYEADDETDGLRQDERFLFAGGLIEWTPRPSIVAGAFLTTVWANSTRAPLGAVAPVDAYELTEQTTEVGVFGIVRLSHRWLVDAWVRHAWRPERRTFTTPGRSDVDFEFRSLISQLVVFYTAPGGFRADVGFLVNRGRTRGAGQVPAAGSLFGNHRRLRYDAGWQWDDRFGFTAGAAVDLDTDRNQTSFGGGRARFMMFW